MRSYLKSPSFLKSFLIISLVLLSFPSTLFASQSNLELSLCLKEAEIVYKNNSEMCERMASEEKMACKKNASLAWRFQKQECLRMFRSLN